MYCDVFALLLQRILISAMKSLKGVGIVLPYSNFISNYGHLHLGCRVSYGPLYFSLAMVDENTFHFTLGISVFLSSHCYTVLLYGSCLFPIID